MIQIHQTPGILRKAFPELTWERKSEDEIFVTFDDGPHPEITPWVLEQLSKFDAKATFFCVGENLKLYPQVAKQIVEAGHLIGNHTHNHLKGWKTDLESYCANVEQCELEIEKTQKKNPLFRPPYGRIKRSQIQKLSDRYEIIMWSHLSWDFDKNLETRKSIRKLKTAGPGSIVVFHDSEKAFENLKILLPQSLEYWHSQKYKLSSL